MADPAKGVIAKTPASTASLSVRLTGAHGATVTLSPDGTLHLHPGAGPRAAARSRSSSTARPPGRRLLVGVRRHRHPPLQSRRRRPGGSNVRTPATSRHAISQPPGVLGNDVIRPDCRRTRHDRRRNRAGVQLNPDGSFVATTARRERVRGLPTAPPAGLQLQAQNAGDGQRHGDRDGRVPAPVAPRRQRLDAKNGTPISRLPLDRRGGPHLLDRSRMPGQLDRSEPCARARARRCRWKASATTSTPPSCRWWPRAASGRVSCEAGQTLLGGPDVVRRRQRARAGRDASSRSPRAPARSTSTRASATSSRSCPATARTRDWRRWRPRQSGPVRSTIDRACGPYDPTNSGTGSAGQSAQRCAATPWAARRFAAAARPASTSSCSRRRCPRPRSRCSSSRTTTRSTARTTPAAAWTSSRPTSPASAASTSSCSTRRAASATPPARSPTTCSHAGVQRAGRQIDPVTGLDACPITARTDGLVGMIPTCPKYESDGVTPSPLAGQAVIANLYPGLYEVQATPAPIASRAARSGCRRTRSTAPSRTRRSSSPTSRATSRSSAPAASTSRSASPTRRPSTPRKASAICAERRLDCGHTCTQPLRAGHQHPHEPHARPAHLLSGTYDHYGFTSATSAWCRRTAPTSPSRSATRRQVPPSRTSRRRLQDHRLRPVERHPARRPGHAGHGPGIDRQHDEPGLSR